MSLVERDSELSMLDDLAAVVAGGEGRVAVVTGPPGIGKTALLTLVSERARASAQVLTAVGGDFERDLPFGIVRQLLDSTVRARARATAGGEGLFSGAARLAAPVFALGDEERTAATLGDVVHGLYWMCADIAQIAPLVIAVDDIHGADEASLRFLSHLARRLDGLPILLLVAGRNGVTLDEILVRVFGGVEVVTLDLTPLSDRAVTTMVRGRLGATADDAFCRACAVASGGNPFLLSEALNSLAADGTPPVAAEITRVARLRPQAVSRAILSRIARSGADSVRFARALAVLGAVGPPGQLAEFAKVSPAAALATADLLAADSIVTASRPVDFIHPLVREAVYGDMSALMRTTEHKRAAHLLEDNGADAEEVAAQLMPTQPESDQWVVAALRRGAVSALRRGAPESAVASLRRARAEPAPPGERTSLASELARASGMAGSLTVADALFREAIDDSNDPRDQLALVLELAGLLARSGRGQEAADAVVLARRFVDWDDPRLPITLQVTLAAVGVMALEPPSVWTARLDRLSGQIIGTTSLSRTVFSIIAFGAAVMGDRPASEVARIARRAAQGPLRHHDGVVLVNMAASALAVAGHTGEALETLDTGIARARAAGDGSDFRYLSVLRSHIAFFAGQLVEAEADARSGLNETADEPRTLNNSLAAAVLIDALVERGAVAEAVEVLEDFELDDWAGGDVLVEHWVSMARGALRLTEHRPADALKDFVGCGRLLTSNGYVNPGFAEWRAGAVVAYRALGQVGSATALADDNLELARRFGAPRSVALALRVAGRSSSAQQRLEYLAEAADLLQQAPDAMLERAHVLAEYGAALDRSGLRSDAIGVLKDGLELAARCDAQPLVVAIRRELHLLGVRPRRTATTGRDSLTASETRVAGLAAQGATNREIAQAIFVTTRTVELHLTNAYRKLQVSGRAELAAALDGPSA